MIGFLIQGEGLEIGMITRPYNKADYTVGRRAPTAVIRRMRLRGRFYEFGWDGPQEDPFDDLPELARTSGNAFVDIYFHDDMKAVDENYPAGSYCFLTDTADPLEASINFPAHYLDWFNEIVRQCDGEEQFFTLSCIAETEEGAEPAQSVTDAVGRLHEDRFSWVHLSAEERRLDRFRPL